MSTHYLFRSSETRRVICVRTDKRHTKRSFQLYYGHDDTDQPYSNGTICLLRAKSPRCILFCLDGKMIIEAEYGRSLLERPSQLLTEESARWTQVFGGEKEDVELDELDSRNYTFREEEDIALFVEPKA